MREDATFYYIVWVILLVLALIERAQKRPFGKGFVALVFFIAAIIVGCRYEVGADWAGYLQHYYTGVEYYSGDYNKGIEKSVEPLYAFFRYIFYSFGLSHAVFFIFLSLVSMYCYYKASKLLGIKFFMTVFFVYFSLVFLNYQFNVIRQGMMASFVWLAFAYKTVDNIKGSLISIAIALGFHYTALAFIPLVFLADRRFPIIEIAIIVGLSFACLIMDVSYRILSFFPILTVLDRTANFVTSETFHIEGGLDFGMIVMLAVFFFVYLYFKGGYKQDSHLRMLANVILFDFLLSCIFNTFNIFQERVCRVLFFSMVFLLPLIVEKFKKPGFKVIAMTVVIAYAFLTFPKTFAVHDDGYSTLLPYKIDLFQIFNGDK